MNSFESSSSLDPELHRSMSLFALRFDLLSSAALAERKNTQHLAEHSSDQFRTEKRYVIPEGANRYIPLRTRRIILAPENPDNTQFGVDRLILRTPYQLRAGLPLPVQNPNDLFIETVSTEGDRARHLLNASGLWLYESAHDLEFIPKPTPEGDLFRVKGVAVSVPDRVNLVNKLLSYPAYLPVLQTSANDERQ